MFSNKKSKLPPRPNIPNCEHVLEDLSNASLDDIAFKILNKDGSGESESNTNISDTYQKVKMYLSIKKQLKDLETMLQEKEEQLKTDNKEIRKLADDIRKQAQAALVT